MLTNHPKLIQAAILLSS